LAHRKEGQDAKELLQKIKDAEEMLETISLNDER
jgi:hypothetical protein